MTSPPVHERGQEAAERGKQTVALGSVLAAVLLTAFKLTVGLLTNSLGILSEAAHSSLDLVAALVTFLAVRVSGRPPDSEHQFGHGKIENLSALLETLLLLATCVWIVVEAVRRLALGGAHVEASAWAFVVMGVSIIVDVGRSRALYRAAREYNSQALEADALHFSTDIWSSAVVIGGLVLVRLADLLPRYRLWLVRGDAAAALGVAAIVVLVSIRLGRRTVDALLDRAPEGLDQRIRAAISQVDHVQECNRLRLRTSGPLTLVEATVRVAPQLPTDLAHEIATRVEEAVAVICSPCDVMVHVEPATMGEEDILGKVRRLAAQSGLDVHDVRAHLLEDGYHIDLDLEVEASLSLREAHRLATDFEESLTSSIAGVSEVETHIEGAPAPPSVSGTDVTPQQAELTRKVQAALTRCHDIRVRQVEGNLYVTLHCLCVAELSVKEAHRLASELEGRLHETLPHVAHFLIHIEPEEAE